MSHDRHQQQGSSDHIDEQELHSWLHQQPASWLADQLVKLSGWDVDLRQHLWQCRRNSQPETWSAADLIDRFVRIAQPGEFRDERVEDAAIASIERFIEELEPLAKRTPPLAGFAAALARILEIMQPMFADWGEGWYWHEVLISAMRIHATACKHDPAAAADLASWIEARLTHHSWPMQRQWIIAAYGEDMIADG